MPKGHTRWAKGLCTAAFGVAVFLLLLPYLPEWLWLQWLVLIALYSPSWWVGILLLPWLVGWRSITKWHWLALPFVLSSAVYFTDLQWPQLADAEPATWVSLSANLGNMQSAEALAQLMQQHDVDVALFQEAKPEKLSAVANAGWQVQCDAGLCIASRHAFNTEHSLSRKVIGGYGNFAVMYRLSLAGVDLSLANVHFETPRPALESLLHLRPDSTALKQRQEDRALQSMLISEWAHGLRTPLLIAGDFNMPVLSPLYRRFFAPFGNAVSAKAAGVVNYTKYTRWHGIRIDHQLYTGGLKPVSSAVLSLPGADHRPVLVKWRF